MNNTNNMTKDPKPKQTSESLLIPMPTPDTVDTVAMAVMHQIVMT